MVEALDVQVAKEKAYQGFLGKWVNVLYAEGGQTSDLGKVSSVENGFLRLMPYLRNLSTRIKLEYGLCEEGEPIPIHVLDIRRIMEVPESYIDDVIEAAKAEIRYNVKTNREEWGVDKKDIGIKG